MEKHGLDVRLVENRSYHYHRSIEQWRKNFDTHWGQIQAIDPTRFDEKFRRIWLFYLAGAAQAAKSCPASRAPPFGGGCGSRPR